MIWQAPEMVWNNPRAILLPWFVLASTIASAIAQSEEPAANPQEWQVHTIRIRRDELWTLISDQRPLPLPSPVASDREQVEAIHSTTKIISDYLQKAHIILPEGTAFLSDPHSSTLAVRTSAGAMADLRSWSRESLRRVPRNLAFTVQIVEAPEPVLHGTLQTASAQSNQASVWAELKPLIDQGQAHIVAELHCDTRSRQRASTEIGPTVPIVTGVLFNEKGGIELTREHISATRFEIDPVLSPNNEDIDFDSRLVHQFAPPEENRIFIGQTTSLGKIELPGKLFHSVTIVCPTTVCNGTYTLLGIWKPQFRSKGADNTMLQAAFLHTSIDPVLPSENLTLSAILTKFANQAEPIPSKLKAADVAPPEGMKTVRFNGPRDFLSLAQEVEPDSSEPPDPFAARPGTDKSIQGPTQSKQPLFTTAQRILQQAGISFPPGAWARFSPDTASLTVTNTQDMIDQVEAFLNSITDGGRPSSIVNSFQIIEADAALMRQILAEDAQKTDHSESLRKLQELVSKGQAKVISVARLLSRSGQRVRCDIGIQSSIPKEFKPDEKGRLKATLGSQIIGTSLEIEEVLGPDGYTMDVDTELDYHYAPPTQPTEHAPSKNFEIAQPTTEYHATTIHTKLTLDTGTTGLVGTWKPESSPDLKGKDVLQAAFLQVNRVYLEP